MKIHQLLSGVQIPMTNQEQKFMDRHDTAVKMTSLDEHDRWIAQNLVRKGAYGVSNDGSTLTRTINETNK
jgi:predicted house-cleaning NTP pyrophosphatase (Maf/HAM1 superfamily)